MGLKTYITVAATVRLTMEDLLEIAAKNADTTKYEAVVRVLENGGDNESDIDIVRDMACIAAKTLIDNKNYDMPTVVDCSNDGVIE